MDAQSLHRIGWQHHTKKQWAANAAGVGWRSGRRTFGMARRDMFRRAGAADHLARIGSHDAEHGKLAGH